MGLLHIEQRQVVTVEEVDILLQVGKLMPLSDKQKHFTAGLLNRTA